MVAPNPRPTAGSRRRRRPNHRAVKVHRNYTVDEAARVTGCAKGTIRRWITSGVLPAITDQRPYLILGTDLKACLAARRPRRRKLRPHECFCLKCKEPRAPALGMVEFLPLSPTTGNMKALCEQCLTEMYKAISRSTLKSLKAMFDVTEQQVPEHLTDAAHTSLNDHLDQEPRVDAQAPS